MKGPAIVALALLAALPARAAGLDPASPPHHALAVALDPDSRAFSATDTVTVDGGGPVSFGLADGLAIRDFRLDGKPAKPFPRGRRWAFNLGEAGRHQVVIDYAGVLAPLPDDRRALGPGSPVADREGGFLPMGSGWYPEFGADRLAFRLDVRVPHTQRAVANGRLVLEEEGEHAYHARFESETPADGLVLLTGPWVVSERDHPRPDGTGTIRLRTYFTRDIEDLAGGYLDDTARYLAMYEDWIGSYPYSAFHVVAGPLPVGLGYPGLTYVGSQVLRLPFIRRTSLGHEILHNWWGNGVWVDYGSGNWCEGLTTFMADYTYALQESPEAGRTQRLEWLRDYAALPAERDRPAIAFVAKTHDAAQVIGYHKVAFLFHMLRREIGREAFDAGVKALWRQHRFRIAAWPDLRRTFEDAAGRDLSRFFAQWLERTGAPELTVSDVTAGDGRVSFTLGQKQGGEPYALSVPVTVTTATGPERFVVALDTRSQAVTVKTAGRPTALVIDGEFELFRRLDAAEAPPILRDVTLSPGAVLSIAADGESAAAAGALAARLLDVPPRDGDDAAAPLLLIATADRLAAALADRGLPPEPAALAGRGSGRAWATRTRDGRPALVVTGNDAAALNAMAGPLPHYGRRGYLVFEGAGAIEKGNWPAGAGPLTVPLP